ncbi:MAG: hypothetical protein ABI556_11550 [Gemmatimonadales bacterium]
MISLRLLALFLGLIASAAGCRKAADAATAETKGIAAKRVNELTQRLAKADAAPDSDKPVAMWIMPVELREISGIALLPDGKIVAHGDEQALIYVIDPRTGMVLDRFHVGKGIHGDFEAITTSGDNVWLLQSNGRIYQFKVGANNAHVPYKVIDTRLGKECEFEGIAYEPDSAWLVMPCKRVLKKSMRGQLVLYRVRLQGSGAGRISELTIPMKQVIGSNKWKEFKPSDITLEPRTGNYVIIASHEKALAVITPDGDVLRSEKLPGKHPQAEGVAITPDDILIVSDEATNVPATITLYRWRQ